MLKLKTRTSTCLDFETFLEICTGPNDDQTVVTKQNAKEFTGFAQEANNGNKIGVFMNQKNQFVVVEMVRAFKDGGFQRNGFHISVDAATCLYNILGKLLKGK